MYLQILGWPEYVPFHGALAGGCPLVVDLRLIRAGCVCPALTYRCRLRFVRSYVTRSLSSALDLSVRNTSQWPFCSVRWLGRGAAIECYLADAYYRPILSTESHRSSPHIIRLRPVLVLCFKALDQPPVGVPIAWRRVPIGETGSGASP